MEVSIMVQKNNGCGDEQKQVMVQLATHFDEIKMVCADALYTEDELMILEGPGDIKLYSIPSGQDAEEGGPIEAIKRITEGSHWALDIFGSPFIHLADILAKTDDAILEARELIQSPVRSAPSQPVPSLPSPVVETPTKPPTAVEDSPGMMATPPEPPPEVSPAPSPAPTPARAAAAAPQTPQQREQAAEDSTNAAKGLNTYLPAPGTPESHLQRAEGNSFYFQVLNRRVALRRYPDLNAYAQEQVVLEVGQLVKATEKLMVRSSEQCFYRCLPSGMWAFKYSAEGICVAQDIQTPYLTYRVVKGCSALLYDGPELEMSERVAGGKLLKEGTNFEAYQVKRTDPLAGQPGGGQGQGGQVAYKVAKENTGWVFKFNQAGVKVIEEIANVPPVCRVKGAHLSVRVTADLSSAKTGQILSPGQTFPICRRIKVPGGGGQVFYKLADGSGWIFKLTANGREVVEELTKAPLDDDCVIC